MRALSLKFGETDIRVDNRLGIQHIYANGNLVSKKFAWFGAKHEFMVMEDGTEVSYIIHLRGNTGLDVFRNGIHVIDLF